MPYFLVWLSSLSVIVLRFTYVVSLNSSFFKNCSVLFCFMDMPRFLHPFTCQCTLGLFAVSITNTAAVNILV